MKGYRAVTGMLTAGLLVLTCTGCSSPSAAGISPSVNIAPVSMESTPVIHYTVPEKTPNILVDQQGYGAEGEKVAVLKGSEPFTHFCLIEQDTKAVVYSGVVERISYKEDLGLYIGYADFSDYTEEGTYYLECDRIGRSVSFRVEEGLYQRLLEELCSQMLQECTDSTISVEEVYVLLTAYEWYPSVFLDEDGDTVPELLEQLADWLEETVYHQEDPLFLEDTLYVATLAKFSYLYQKYDVRYATACLQHASTVFAGQQASVGKDAENFLALTELYRATGLYTYRNQILDYKDFFENNSSFLEEPAYLYGAITYMATRQKVDVTLCAKFMESIRNRGEEIAKRAEDIIHPLTARNNGTEDILKRSLELSCSNYILNSYQYTGILEDFLHYLMGRNLESACFYPEEGSKSIYLLLLAQIAASQ